MRSKSLAHKKPGCDPRGFFAAVFLDDLLRRRFRNTGVGFVPSATPSGVPVMMMSPGSITKNCEQYHTRCSQPKIMVRVLPRWRFSTVDVEPHVQVVRIP